MALVYDAVALVMWLYTHLVFDVTTLAPRRFRLRPRTLIVCTHRRETDVPLLCPPMYFRAALWRHRSRAERMTFSARDDMFLPGFFAGFPPGLSPRVRRLLYPIDVGSILPRTQVHPLRSATVARLGEILGERPELPLDEALPPADADDFRRRAAACGLRPPAHAGDVLRGEYADLLWRPVSAGDVAAEGLDGFWRRRAAQATSDFRTLIGVLRSGGSLVVFPEGRPSPDGTIGPIQRGLAALVRRAEPDGVQPIALAYDPLTRGRTRAFVAIGEPVDPPAGDIDASVLALLRRTTPLTCGQVVADRLAAGATGERDLAAALEAALEEARTSGRSVDPDLVPADRGRSRLAEALAAAASHADALPYLAREFRSARELPTS